MRKVLNLIFGLILASFVCMAQDAVTTSIPENALTPGRIEKLQKMLAEQISSAKGSMSSNDLENAVLGAFSTSEVALKNCGKKPPVGEDETIAAAEANLEKAALEKYPKYTPAELIAQSEKLYPLYKRGQKVAIRIRTNPKKTERIEGHFNGFSGGIIAIGPKNYRLADMVGIQGNDGPEGEIAKFDPGLNKEYRQAWREQYVSESIVGRTKFKEENKEAFDEAQHARDFLENEKRGYTYYRGRWMTPQELVSECAYEAATQAQKDSKLRNQVAQDLRVQAVSAQIEMTEQSALVAPQGVYPSAEKVLVAKAEEEARVAEQKLRRERQAKELAARLEEEARQAESRRQADMEKKRQQASQQEVVEEETGLTSTHYAIGGVLAVLIFLGIGWWWNRSHREDDLDVSKFYEGKGKLQKEFWDAASADPEHFKYVAYLFPSMESAKDALLRLSYIGCDENGNLSAKKSDLRFGCYDHQNGAVAFVGSSGLNYARWREASMLWPDIPQSTYFKVSSEPQVSLVLPDLTNNKSGVKVENLGVEDIRTESGEINRVYRFKVSTKEEAIKFLNSFEIQEEGLVVRVETADGAYGKDMNGVFEA